MNTPPQEQCCYHQWWCADSFINIDYSAYGMRVASDRSFGTLYLPAGQPASGAKKSPTLSVLSPFLCLNRCGCYGACRFCARC